MINYIKDQDFVKFKDAVIKTVENKVNSHPKVYKQNQEFERLQNMKSLFQQINKK
jgi:cell fate (sporulation/competence/biofilm development) regulator YmcA (YheA/YmcA/DUF963 family)